jgi:hypothetical protein
MVGRRLFGPPPYNVNTGTLVEVGNVTQGGGSLLGGRSCEASQASSPAKERPRA